MTDFLLVRHAAHDWLGRGIPGRLPGVALNAQGRVQAEALAERLLAADIGAIYSSPQLRARETAAPLAARLRLQVGLAGEFDEVDFGDWTGHTMAQVEADTDRWRHWVERRSSAAPPGGEPFIQVQQRVLAGIERLGRRHPNKRLVVVSHGDVIKAALAAALGTSLDHLERFDIDPASLSIVVHEGGTRLRARCINHALAGPVSPA